MLSYTKHLGETENNISGLEIYLQRKDLSPIIEEEFASETQNSDRSTSALPLVSPPFSWEARAMHEIRDCSWNFLRLSTVEASHQQCLCCYCLSSEAVKYSAAHSTCQSHLSWFLSNVWKTDLGSLEACFAPTLLSPEIWAGVELNDANRRHELLIQRGRGKKSFKAVRTGSEKLG